MAPSGGSTHHLILALGRRGQVDLCEFEAILVYRVNSSTAFTEKPCLEKGGRERERESACERE